jgi:CrcB protein
MNIILIFFGAGLGGVCRYAMSHLVHHFLGRGFPYGTLIVNISGSFLMGFLFVFTLDRLPAQATFLRALLLIGFLGGYTTFSSFSIETWNLFESGAWSEAFLNIMLHVILCLLFTWIGVIGARQL